MTRDKMAELADEIERSEGLLRIVPGEGIVSLGIKRTAMVVAALRCVPPIDDYTNEWHPISSVPTDGRPIFALHNTQGPQALFANIEWIESQCQNYTHWSPRKVGDRSDKAPPSSAAAKREQDGS